MLDFARSIDSNVVGDCCLPLHDAVAHNLPHDAAAFAADSLARVGEYINKRRARVLVASSAAAAAAASHPSFPAAQAVSPRAGAVVSPRTASVVSPRAGGASRMAPINLRPAGAKLPGQAAASAALGGASPNSATFAPHAQRAAAAPPPGARVPHSDVPGQGVLPQAAAPVARVAGQAVDNRGAEPRRAPAPRPAAALQHANLGGVFTAGAPVAGGASLLPSLPTHASAGAFLPQAPTLVGPWAEQASAPVPGGGGAAGVVQENGSRSADSHQANAADAPSAGVLKTLGQGFKA